MKRTKYYDFVVLPARGVLPDAKSNSAIAAETAIEAVGGDHAGKTLQQLLDLFEQVPGLELLGTEVAKHLGERAGGKRYGIRSVERHLDGGPVAVRATAEGERVMRAAGLRVLKQQKYPLVRPLEARELQGAEQQRRLRDFRSALFLDSAARNAGLLGQGVVVGVVDSGIDGSHPALAHCVKGGRNFSGSGLPDEWGPAGGADGWHGTHVAGIIGARDPLGRCPDGIAPEAHIRSYRVFGAARSAVTKSAMIINAIIAAIDDGCDIVNLSLGGWILREDGVRDAINYAWDQGVVCVAAAGNGKRRPVTFPAAHPNCIGVSAIGHEDTIDAGSAAKAHVSPPRSKTDPKVFVAGFSNFGPQVDFAGPGVAIVSTLPGDRIGESSGTSMAAPAISGSAAVALSRNRNILTAKRDKDRAAAMFAMLVHRARPFDFGSFDYEGYGVPL